MKSVIKATLVILLIGILSPMAFAMGGPPEEVSPNGSTQPATEPAVQATPAQSNKEASPEEINKATIELVRLESKLDRVEDYLDVLSKKMIKARVDGNGNKVIELKAREAEALSQQKNLKEKISKIREKYPELRDQQVTEAQKPAQEVQQKSASIEASQKPFTEPAQKPAPSNIIYHEVGMGDSLMNISRQYFNTPIYYKEIARMNNITDLGYLPQGTRLMIDLSLAGKPLPAEVQKKEPVKPEAEMIIYHVVAQGDTLMSISRRYYGASEYYRDIASLNGLTAASQLKIGMKLKIDKNLKSRLIVVPQL